jgi:hypothetical protein
MLRLAWEFQAEEWYEDCLKEILASPPIELVAEDYRDLEPTLTHALLHIRNRCLKHRLELIPYILEATHASNCRDRGRCERDWGTAYSAAMLFYAHTKKFYTGREIFEKLGKVEIPGCQPECRKLTMDELGGSGVMWKEEQFVAKGVETSVGLLKNTRPLLPRPKPRYLV